MCLDLRFQAAAAQAVCDGLADVKVPCGGVFDALDDLENMAPRQLRNRLFRNWLTAKSDSVEAM